MKRKIYATRRERITDELIGFLAFPLVNVPLGIILWMILHRIDGPLQMLVSAVPGVVNGIVFILAVLMRPEFAIGYIAFIGAVMALAVGASVAFVAACFVIISLAPDIGDPENLMISFLIAGGLLGLAGVAIFILAIWQSSNKDHSL